MTLEIQRVCLRASERDKVRFVEQLASDLRSRGVRARVTRSGKYVQGAFWLDSEDDALASRIRSRLREEQRRESKRFLVEMERVLLRDLLSTHSVPDLSTVDPVLIACDTRDEHAIYRYCRLQQGVPSANRVGRQCNFLVIDFGQRTPALIGAIGIASSLYNVGERDKLLGWIGPTARGRKVDGLRRIADLAICVSLPPYSDLLGAKLLAGLATTNAVADHYRAKYGETLHALVSTCSGGLHCPIFNRIMVRPGGLFRRIGSTTGYSTVLFGQGALAAARKLVGERRAALSGGSNPMRTLRKALALTGLPSRPFLRVGTGKGIYVAEVTVGGIAALRDGNPDVTFAGARHTVDEIAHFWRQKALHRMDRQEFPQDFRR